MTIWSHKGKFKWSTYLILLFFSQLYLDKYNLVDAKFISQLWKGEKKAFKLNQIHLFKLPMYEELEKDKLIEMVTNDDKVKQYLHDDFANKKKPSR